MLTGDSRRSRPIVPQRTYLRTTQDGRPQLSAREIAAKEAAAHVVRNQIENIYQETNQPSAAAPQTALINRSTDDVKNDAFSGASQPVPENPYERTHVANRTKLYEDHWKKYHSAWQDYYKQYYERFYLGEIYRLQQHTNTFSETTPNEQPQPTHDTDANQTVETLHVLKSDLLENVRESAQKTRKSIYFMPLVTFVLTGVMIFFLQYNRVLFANVEAYVSPGSINPANIIIDPNLNVPVSKEPRLIIPKINVDVPVVYDVTPDQESQLRAMERGVAWFGIPGANSRPGQKGNTVLSGHSSNDLFDPGDYKFIFARLDQLAQGDTFYLNYQGVRYTYSITKKEVVKPTDVHKLVYAPEKPIVTLITCVPLGTAQNRLLVTAEQVSPSPNQAKEATKTDAPKEEAAMPGNSPNLLNRLFGSNS